VKTIKFSDKVLHTNGVIVSKIFHTEMWQMSRKRSRLRDHRLFLKGAIFGLEYNVGKAWATEGFKEINGSQPEVHTPMIEGKKADASMRWGCVQAQKRLRKENT